jgi:hypothetical protein
MFLLHAWVQFLGCFQCQNKQSFIFLPILVFIRDYNRLREFWTLNTFGNISVLFNNAFMCFAILYLGLSFRLTIHYISLSRLCNFIVPHICGALGFVLMNFHLLFVFITFLHFFRLLCKFCCSLFVMSFGSFMKLFLLNSSILLLLQ